MENELKINIYPAYGGRGVNIEGKIGNKRYKLDIGYVIDLLEMLACERGFTLKKEGKQRIERLTINI